MGQLHPDHNVILVIKIDMKGSWIFLSIKGWFPCQDVPGASWTLVTQFDKNISKAHALKLFNKIYITVNSRYFPLIYQLLQSEAMNEEFHSLMFEVIKRDKEFERDKLSRLLDCMLGFWIAGYIPAELMLDDQVVVNVVGWHLIYFFVKQGKFPCISSRLTLDLSQINS